jgi:hypothetical protein
MLYPSPGFYTKTGMMCVTNHSGATSGMKTKVNHMNTNLLRSCVGLAVVCFLLSLGQSLLAGPSPAAGLLVQAYTTLEQADHDYNGHRKAAMNQIEATAKLLGVRIRG